MQFTLSSGTLNARLQTLVRVIGGKNAISILDCFLFEVANNTLTVTASDAENVMQATIELDECTGEGRFALPNHTILNAVKELPEQPLQMTIDDQSLSLVVDYQNGSFGLAALAADDYPEMPAMSDDATVLTLSQQLLAETSHARCLLLLRTRFVR